MATGGSNLDSTPVGSQEDFDFTCSTCAELGNYTEATVFCVECAEFLCQTCLKFHNSFGKMKVHTLTGSAAMKGQDQQRAMSIPTEKCLKHHGRILDTYCGLHDEVCCSVCISVDHRACTGISYIPDVAEGITATNEVKDVKDEMNEILPELHTFKNIRKEDIITASEGKEMAIRSIKTSKDNIIKHLEKLERASIDDVDIKYLEVKNKINGNIEDIEKVETELEMMTSQIGKSNLKNESQIFVYLKTSKKALETGKRLLKDRKSEMESNCQDGLHFKVNTDTNNVVSKIKCFGKASNKFSYSPVEHGTYNVLLRGEKRLIMYGACQLENGSFVISDWENKKLKRLSGSYSLLDSVSFTGSPNDVCVVNANEVAVAITYLRLIQFVFIDSAMTLSRNFSVGENCRGVHCLDDKIYVSCGGKNSNESPGKVNVYNKTGTWLQSIQKDANNSKLLTMPSRICASRCGNRIHIVDRTNGIVTFDKDGEFLSTVRSEYFEELGCVCVDSHNVIFASGAVQNNIVRFDRNLESSNLFLSSLDNVNKVGILCYDSLNHRLIVGLDISGDILVFDMIQSK